MSFETFLRRLNDAGIKQILDVRCNPISRKPGFSKKQLAGRLSVAEIDYFHFPELGIPASMRRVLNSKSDYQHLFDEYESEILPHATEQMKIVAKLLEKMPSALLCFENDRECCHRTRLAIVISNQTGFLKKYL
ncbi:MAG: DUF488 domain-containing protein [Planctomycetaceae bacterium]|nr:DUF488 domain-containing protein [Planctomycetaceae bacterium]